MNIVNKILKILITVAIFVVLMLVFILLTSFITSLIVGKDYLFYEHNQVASLFLQIFIVFPPLIVTISLATKFKLISSVSKAEKNEEIIYFWNRLGKFRLAVIAVYFIVLFCLISSVNVVYSDKIVTKSVFNLKGTEYSYEQVEEIKCGFGDSSFSVLNYKEKGSFYYQIKLSGKFITFYQPTVNADNEILANNTYLELEQFDVALVELNINKISSENGVEYCSYDKEYVDRFLRIINNKRS